MSARSKILDAYESILIEEGERAATLDAVAARAEVSKGGLLYHFRDKNALAEGILGRLQEMAEEDVAAMRAAPDGCSAYYVRTSVYEESGLDRALVATLQLGQEAHPRARQVIEEIHERWLELIVEEVGNRAIARAILLIGDGLYYTAALTSGLGPAESVEDRRAEIEQLLGVVERLKSGV
ncbi:TetR/AcrR family transcriptional regulator [Rothia sp. AR01]|uniref:TetR/AcrR family transcriptional regulator n=1 Tax=Rothia santali TaxID=2949643 RepID=A0A9X2HAN6_9MICC|nr:TetR/AcrR family transcriptional regulator [Rothia santali]MCP3424640.1 TetR/AcrR family transcriptional regulator [Rothia santali]